MRDDMTRLKTTISSFLLRQSITVSCFAVALSYLVFLFTGCKLDNPGPPELVGPSELGLAIEMRAVPDSLVSDGLSNSIIEAVVRDSNGERIPERTINFDITRDGADFLDLGNLAPVNGPRPSAGGVEAGPVSAVTDSDGVARVRYWSPFRTDQENDVVVGITGREASINYSNQTQRSVAIFLRAADRPSFPGQSVCSFIWEPDKLKYTVGESIAFTATQSIGDTDSSCVGNEIARYEWAFGDGYTKTGRGVTHAFTTVATHTVILITHEAITGCRSTCSVTLDVE